MENCWFVLKQTHYPPPVLPKNGIGVATGAVCLGHVIPDPKLLDNVINTKVELKFGPSMPIHSTKIEQFRWERTKGTSFGIDADVGIPLAVDLGITASGLAGVAFQKSVRNFWEFESLDMFIVQPTKSYIADSLEEEEVAEYIEDHTRLNRWKVYMITGISIARGATMEHREFGKLDAHGGTDLDAISTAKAKIQAGREAGDGMNISHQKTTDFVWAVRLTKISKGALDKNWSYRVASKGATFGVQEDREPIEEIHRALSKEGLADLELIGCEDGDVFVIPA